MNHNLVRAYSFTILIIALLLATGTAKADKTWRQFGDSNSQTAEQTGKRPATQGAQPWMVSLAERGVDNGYDAHFCGGSLIAPQWVLTAAHCLEDTKADDVDLIINRHRLSSDNGERIPASQLIIHPGYDNLDDGEDNDIALIKLARPATQGQTIPLINQATQQRDDAGTMARVMGWGRIPEQGVEVADLLHNVHVPIVRQATCNAVYDGDLTADSVCAGFEQGGADSCEGDSGGPLVVPNGASWLQVGIVSWGGEAGCGAAGQYGVYTRLTEYASWIQAQMGAPTATAPANPPTTNWTAVLPAGYTLTNQFSEGETLVWQHDGHNDDFIDIYIAPAAGQTLADQLPFTGDVWTVALGDTRLMVEELGSLAEPYSIATFKMDGKLYIIEGTVSFEDIVSIAEKMLPK